MDQDKYKKRIGYVFDKELLLLTNYLPEIQGRAILVHQLIAAYGLLNHCHRIPVTLASDEVLRQFHSAEFIEHVKKISAKPIDEQEDEDNDLYGLSYDCPPIPRLYQTIAYLAGSSIAAAKSIINKQCDIALNWFGGWHHGHRDEASGFCYTNDIVFAILTFLENGYSRILYIDLDLHHGDGVEAAFAHTDKVLTISIHKHEVGFFPGTGDVTDIGYGAKGKYFAVNMPLEDGIDDSQYMYIFDNIVSQAEARYKPQVVICQCGADALSGDRMRSFNLTTSSYEHCLRRLIALNIPMVLLGGGGYNQANTAKLWTIITASVLHQPLDTNIPEHNFFLHYGPDYDLSITQSNIPNKNLKEKIDHKLKQVLENLNKIS